MILFYVLGLSNFLCDFSTSFSRASNVGDVGQCIINDGCMEVIKEKKK